MGLILPARNTTLIMIWIVSIGRSEAYWMRCRCIATKIGGYTAGSKRRYHALLSFSPQPFYKLLIGGAGDDAIEL
jgi:hypothetical protein